MKTYDEIKSIVDLDTNNSSCVIKPVILTETEWHYFNEIENLKNLKQQAQNQVYSFECKIQDFMALHGDYNNTK